MVVYGYTKDKKIQEKLNELQRANIPLLQHTSLVRGSVLSKHIIWMLLCSSLIAACIIQTGTFQPSYQEGVEQGKAETFTEQFFSVSTLADQSQSSSATNVQTNINNNGISTYQNPSLGLSLQYPSNWKVEERTDTETSNVSSNTSSIKFTSPSKRDLFVVSAYTQNLSSFPVEQQQNITLDTITRMGINTAKGNLNNFQLLDLDTANVTLGLDQNNQAHKIIYSNTNTNTSFPLQFVTMQTYTIKDGRIYGISYVSEASQFFRHLPAVQRMIDSFRITD